jgi:hypothetical protein
MTKEEIVRSIRVCAKKLHRNPSLRELRVMADVPAKAVYKRLGGLSKALQAAGLEGIGPGFSPAEETALRDWAMVARKLRSCRARWNMKGPVDSAGSRFTGFMGAGQVPPRGSALLPVNIGWSGSGAMCWE